MPKFRSRSAAALLESVPYLLVIGTVCYLYSIVSDGHLFNEDYAVYLQQAWNIVHHAPMQQMGVIQYIDPGRPLLRTTPFVYPPLLPLIFALPVDIFGINIIVFKMIQLAMFLAGLLLFCYAMRRWRFTVLEISVSVLLMTLCAEIRQSVNTIDSDLPSIFFLVLALMAAQALVEKNGSEYTFGIISGIAIFLAVAMRTAAAPLLPALFLADLIVHRRVRWLKLSVPVATIAVLWLAQSVMFHSVFSYGLVLRYRFFTPLDNIRQFYWSLAIPLTQSALPRVALAVLIALAALALCGVVYEAAKGMVVAVFIICYTAMLLVLPDFDAGARYLFPQLLVFGAFAVRGASLIAGLLRGRLRNTPILPIGTAAAAVLLAGLSPDPLPAGHWDFGATAAPARQTFAFIRNHIPADAILAATMDRSFHLFTQRTTIRFPYRPPADLLPWLRRYGVTAVAIKYSAPHWKYDFSDCPGLEFCRADAVEGAKEVFRNADYAVFTIAPQPDRPPPAKPEAN